MTQFDRDLVAVLPVLRLYASRLIFNREAAEDLVQDTIERALRYRENFLPGTNMVGWLKTVCLRRYISQHHRKAWRWQQLGELEESMLPAVSDQHMRLELKETLAAVYRLPAEQRDAVMWRALGDDLATIAEESGIPVGTVKSRLHRGHASLREVLHA